MATGAHKPLRLDRPVAPRGLTLVELLVAIAIVALLLGVLLPAYYTIQRSYERTQLETDAATNLRVALEQTSRELKQVNHPVPGAGGRFLGQNVPLAYGNAIDDDGDDVIDEEQPDGIDEDADATTDRHAQVGGFFERPNYVGSPDLGDPGVDEDTVFQSDRLQFRIAQNPPVDYLYADISYEVGNYDGEDRVLIRSEERTSVTMVVEPPRVAPLAYNVLSFNCLYWNPNAQPSAQYWLTEWDSDAPPPAGGGLTEFEVPAAVMLELTLYGETERIADYTEGEPVQTLSLHTVVALEDVIQDANYPRD